MEGFLYEPKTKKSKTKKSKTSFINIIGRDVWELVTLFLSLDDFKNLRLCSKNIQTKLRALFFRRFRVIITKKVLLDPLFVETIHHVGVVKINNLKDLEALVCFKRGLSGVYDTSFDFEFNQNVDNLPPTLTHLIFGYCFDQSVDNLPPNLTHLTFERQFNQSVDNLPSTLTHLTFDWYSIFNQSVDRLPHSLTHLEFGWSFNRSVERLPPILTHLTFGKAFNQSIEKLPRTLVCLTIPKSYNKSIPSWIPKIIRK